MATATGTWIAASNINAGFIDLARQRSKEITKDDLIDQRRYHYSFNVDDKGIDISGFIVHTNKTSQGRQKFRVHLDENENGRFDKSDPYFGRSILDSEFAQKGVGNLLDEDQVGQLVVKFKKIKNKSKSKCKSNASMRSDQQDPLSGVIVKSMNFNASSDIYDPAAPVSKTIPKPPYNCTAEWVCKDDWDYTVLGDNSCYEIQQTLAQNLCATYYYVPAVQSLQNCDPCCCAGGT